MTFVFFGTPEFAAIVLRHALDAGLLPAAVVCNPDRPTGRKKIVTPPPVKQLIAQGTWPIEILQPEKLGDIHEKLQAIRPDFFIVAAYAKIIPQSILDIPSRGTIGVHPSLLPHLRGASPIQSAILDGERETGVSLYAIDADMDHGPIYRTERLADYDADHDTTATLLPRLADLGGRMLAKLLSELQHGTVTATPQDHTQATFTKKFTTDDTQIAADELTKAESGTAPELALSIHQKIRAFFPEPGAWTVLNGKRRKLLAAETRGGKLFVTKYQDEGKKPVG